MKRKNAWLILCIYCIFASLSHANPIGGVVTSGNATISNPSPNVQQINQTTGKAIINWQSFNIQQNEATHFIQPAGGITLNRVNDLNGASQIYGTLTATGSIILINPAGVYFGSGAHVSVGSLIVSTTNILDKNFLASHYVFDQGSSSGVIINRGTIIAAQHGLVALVGNSVSNSGYIQANLGTIVLGSAKKFTIDLTGNQLVNFTINEGVTNQKSKYAVSNTGQLIANGGKILISANSASSVLDHSINMSGLAQANSVGKYKGQIILSSNGSIHVRGKILARGKAKHSSGGNIQILGNSINIDSSTLIDASAIHSGNGGKIIVLANDAATVQGILLATGGKTSGSGGFIETSGKNYLNVNGIHINTGATNGSVGVWLLDPADLTISASSDSNVTSESPFVPATQSSNSILNISTLLAALANGNVVIETGAGSGPGNGDIFINTPITWSSGNNLTISAYRNINAITSITNTGGASAVLRADNTGTGIGTVSFTGGNNIALSGGSGTASIYYNPTVFGTQDAIYTGGTTPTQYMLVNNAVNLQNINNYLNQNFALGRNITLAGNFTPIGTTATPFTGNFDGQGYSINNLSITNTTANVNLGLFGVISTANIKNITLNNVTISQNANNNNNSTYIGSLVGLSTNGVISNAYVNNPVITLNGTNFGLSGSRGYYNAGGLIGGAFGGSITNTGSIGGSITNHLITNVTTAGYIAFNEIGGLLGGAHNSAALDTVYSTTNLISDGNLTVNSGGTGEIIVGGLIGRLDTSSTLYNAYSTGNVNVTNTMLVTSGAGYTLIGGLIGITSIPNTPSIPPPSIFNVYSTGNVNLAATLAPNSAPQSGEFLIGGLMGQSNAVLDTAYSTGKVTASFNSDATSSGNTFGIGGLAAINFTIINNAYSTSPITLTGNNYGNQVLVGGLVGNNVTLFDKEITNSYSSGLINLAMNNYNGGQIYSGGFVGLNIYYGNPPPDRLPIANSYSISIQNVSGVNDNSTTVLGSFIGANGSGPGDPGGDIINSYSSGFINNNISTINGGTTLAAGFLGQTIASSDPLSPPLVLSGNFYDTGTTGFNQNQGIGNQPGAVSGITPGCFGGGACPNGGSADLSSQTTFENQGWDFATTWAIINNASYPYLLNANPTPPQVISGTTAASAGNIVNLVANGVIIDSTLTGPNGFYYFFEPTNTIALNNLGLIYLSGSSVKSNAIFTPANDGSGAGVNLNANTILVGSDSPLTIANSQLINLINGLIDNDILYSGSGTTVTIGTNLLPNINFITTANTTYTLDGQLNNITGGTGNITYNGPVLLTTNSSINSHDITFANILSGSAYALTLTSNGAVAFNNIVTLDNLDVSANTTQIGTNSITTIHNQIYHNAVNLNVDTTMTAANIDFDNGITGGKNLSLLGQAGNNNFTLSGSLALNNVTVTGSSNGTNTLTLNNNSPETWNILSVNTGNVTGLSSLIGSFNFNRIANLIGGLFGNTFNFNDATYITGMINGRNLAVTNTLNLGNYSSIFNVKLDNIIYNGNVYNSLLNITAFNNINNVIGNDISSLILPNKTNTVTFTAYNAGYIDDPLYFERFGIVINPNDENPIPPSPNPISLSSASAFVSRIIEGGNLIANEEVIVRNYPLDILIENMQNDICKNVSGSLHIGKYSVPLNSYFCRAEE